MSGLKNFSHCHDDAFSRIDRSELVQLLTAYYRDVGWWVEHVGAGGSDARFDDGVDLKIRRDADFVLVQCKHWDTKEVVREAVDALVGRMVDEGATGGILVSRGEFARAAIEVAQRHGQVKLIDREVLRAMLGPVPGAFSPPEVPAPAARRPAAPAHASRWLWLAALTCAIAFVFIVRAILVRTADTAVESPPEPVQAPASEPTVVVYTPQPVAPVPAVTEPPPRPQTETEIRASQRKAGDAMRLIEEDTPEI